MKKFTFSFKSLLVAAGLLLGSANAWAGILSPSAGNVDNSTAWNTWDEGFTQNYTMSGNSTASFTFHYTSDPTASEYAGWTMFIGKTINTTDVWDTWITCQGFSGGYYGAAGVGGTRLSSNTYAGTLSAASCTEADVTVTITRTAENITAVAAVDPTSGAADYTITWTYTYGGSDVVNGDLYISFAVEKAYLNITEVVGPGLKTTQANIGFSSAETSNDNVLESSVFNGTLNSITIGQGQFRASQAGWLSLDDATSTIVIPSALRAGAKDVVNVQFKRAWGNKSGMGSGVSLKDADGEVIFNFTFARWGGGSNNANINMDGLLGAALSYAPIKERYTIFDITINYATHTITSTVECVNTDGKGTHKSETFYATLTNNNPIATFNAWGYNVGGNKDRADIINDILITTTKGDYSISEVGYTVKFVDGNGTKVKEDVTDREGVPGTDISILATSDDQTTFYNDGDIANNNTSDFAGATNKYVYKSISAVNSSEEPITELEADAVVTIVYDKYNKYDYAVKQKLGDAAATDKATGTLWEDQTYSYYFPIGVEDGGDYYFTEANGSSPYFKTTVTSAEPTVTINYTLDPTVVFYSEGEDLASKTGTYTHYPDLMANASCGVLNADDGNLVANLPAGYYAITARTVGRGDGGRNIYFYKGSVDPGNIVLTTTPNYTTGSTETSETIALADATDILVKGAEGGGASGRGLDYVIIRKTAVSATISEAGYATFSSEYALDLTTANTPAGLTAYYINSTELSKNNAPFTTINQTVAAGQGILLKGAAGTYNIKVAASGTALSGNALVATNGSAIPEGNYVFAYQNSTYANPGFYYVSADTDPVAAGKAYLDGSLVPKGVKSFIFGDDTATGVEAPVVAEAEEDGVLYNTSGQQVTKDYKGIVIKNGKKYLNK